MSRHFADELVARIGRTTCIVVGIDPNFDLMPAFLVPEDTSSATVQRALVRFSRLILEAVADRVPAVKLQSAYFEQFGMAGWQALMESIQLAKKLGILVILDSKMGDIGSTAQAYADGYLAGRATLGRGRVFISDLGVDCVTVNPFLGEDSVLPFIDTATQHGTGVFILVKTSNPGSGLFMDARCQDGTTVSEQLADLVTKWGEASIGQSRYSCIGAVIGATHPGAVQRLRERMPHAMLLVPGVGHQGGTIEATRACFHSGQSGAVIAISRAITYPSVVTANSAEFQRAVRDQLERYSDYTNGTNGNRGG